MSINHRPDSVVMAYQSNTTVQEVHSSIAVYCTEYFLYYRFSFDSHVIFQVIFFKNILIFTYKVQELQMSFKIR